MGKKTKTEVGPSKFAQPYISSAANAVQGAYQANQPNLNNITSVLENNMPSVLASTLNNPTLGAANTYTQNVLSGQYLNSNPYLQSVINNTNADVVNQANAAIGSRGGAGGSAQAQIIARELAKNESNLRLSDYNTERGYQQSAAQNASSLSGANDSNIQALLAYLGTQATLPMSGAQSYASSVGNLLGQYNTTTQSNSFAQNLQNYLVSAAAAASKAAGAGA